MYVIIEGDTFVWRKASKHFDLDIFQVGEKINFNSIIGKSVKDNKPMIHNIPRSDYGTRLKVSSEPLVNEKGQIMGAFLIIFPILHPTVSSFSNFAPILAEMFPEGAFLYVTDLHTTLNRQPSKKFDMPTLTIGYEFKETDVSSKVIKTKQPVMLARDGSKYGIPILITCYPLFDEDNSDEVVGTLGVVIPRAIANSLNDMSGNLKSGIEVIASAIEQLGASASTIYTNEQELNKEITDIISLSEEINEVSTFIKDIAEKTKMLGLNAAIEAARAGEAGQSFGVVAKEIRKLSEQSNSTVPKIKKLTDSIKEKVSETSQKSEASLVSSGEQATATEEITASIQEITSISEELNKIAHDLLTT
jgi:uncharacterized protein YukE